MNSTSYTDIILQKINDGKDDEAINLLYKKVFPLVKKYIVGRGGDKEDVFDLFQDALVEFYKMVGAKKYDSRYKVEAFVYNLCIHKWLNKIKRDQRLVFKDDLEMTVNQYVETERVDYQFLGKEEQLIHQLFEKIGDKCKELLTYTIFNDLMMEDIVIRMGFASIAAAKMQHQRCKQKVLDEIHSNPEILNKLKGI